MLWAAALITLSAASAPAEAWLKHGASVSGTCANPATAAADGCAGANWAATTQDSNLLSSTVRQSGQAAYSKLPAWNVAGQDYPVGYYTPLASLQDPTVTVPPNCDYWPTGGTNNTAFNQISPSKAFVSCPHSSGQSIDVEGYNFGPAGAHDCIPLVTIGNMLTAGTTVTIKNNLFKAGADCANNATGTNGGAVLQSENQGGTYGSANWTVANNTFDGGPLGAACCNQPTTGYRASVINTEGNLTYQYNATINWAFDPIFLSVGAAGTAQINYNYGAMWVPRTPIGHAEWGSIGTPTVGGSSSGNFTVSYNMLWQPTTGSGGTAILWYSDGVQTRVFGGANLIDHNVLVANRIGGVLTSCVSEQVSGTVGNAAGTGAGNIFTITSFNKGGCSIVAGASIGGTGMWLYQYQGVDGSGHQQWTFDCSAAAGATCAGVLYSSQISAGPTSVTNATTDNNTVGNGVLTMQNTYTNQLVITNNYIDPTGAANGAAFYSVNAICNGGASSFSGNFLMTTGAAANAWSGTPGSGC